VNRGLELLRRSRPLSIGGGIVLALLIAMLATPGRLPFGIVLQGALYGTTTGLLGIGLVLTYRSDRIVNFSYGAMGGVGGFYLATTLGFAKKATGSYQAGFLGFAVLALVALAALAILKSHWRARWPQFAGAQAATVRV